MVYIKEMRLTPHEAKELVRLGFVLTLMSMGKVWDLYKISVN